MLGLRLRPAPPERLRALLDGAAGAPLTYDAVGVSLRDEPAPPGLRRRTWTTPLAGDRAFERAAAALRTWELHRRSGFALLATGDVAPGAEVAATTALPVVHVEITCRVVDVVDEADRSGFAYGTLPVHPERGEESFVVERAAGATTFAVTAVAAPAHPLARVAPPLSALLQDRAVERYLAAMRAIAAG